MTERVTTHTPKVKSTFIEGYTRAIKSVMPPHILLEAEGIVSSHRPTDLPEGFEVYNMAGLKPQHHGELNVPGQVFKGGKEAKAKKITELRQEYANDPVALQQIDVYEGDNEYSHHLQLFVKALKSGDAAKEAELDAWFKEHYPDIK